MLHDLDTIAPLDLFDQLVAVAMASSMRLLAASPGAELPAVDTLVRKYHRQAY